MFCLLGLCRAGKHFASLVLYTRSAHCLLAFCIRLLCDLYMFIRPIVHVERLESVVFELSHERVCVIARVWVGRFSVEHMRVLLREDHGAADEVGYPVERSVRVESVHAVVEEEVDFDEVVFVDLPRVDYVCVCRVST